MLPSIPDPDRQPASVSISGKQAARFLRQPIEHRGKPRKVNCDNGTEFTGNAMFFWSKESGVELWVIQLGKPLF